MTSTRTIPRESASQTAEVHSVSTGEAVVDVRDSVTDAEIDAQLAAITPKIVTKQTPSNELSKDIPSEIAAIVDPKVDALRAFAEQPVLGTSEPSAIDPRDLEAMAGQLTRISAVEDSESQENSTPLSAKEVRERFLRKRGGSSFAEDEGETDYSRSTLGEESRARIARKDAFLDEAIEVIGEGVQALKQTAEEKNQVLDEARTKFAKMVQKNRTSVRQAVGSATQKARVKSEQSEALRNWLDARSDFVQAKATVKRTEGFTDEAIVTKEILLDTYANDLEALKKATDEDKTVEAKLVKWFSRGEIVTKAIASAAVENVRENGFKEGVLSTVTTAKEVAEEAINSSDKEYISDFDFSAYASENPEDHKKRLANDRPRLRAKVLKGAAIAAVATAVIYKAKV